MEHFPKQIKKIKNSWLIVKPEKCENAKDIIKDTKLSITRKSKRYLQAAVGTEECAKENPFTKVKEWASELKF